jgi:hypothetical protein
MSPDYLPRHGLRELPLRAGATLASFLNRHADERSRMEKIAAGLLTTGAAVVLAQRLGADVRGAVGGQQPDLAVQVIRSFLSRRAEG